MPMKHKLTPAAKRLIEAFSDAAQSWGYQESEGSGEEADRAERKFNESKQALVEYIAKLQQRKRAKKKALFLTV